MRKKIFSKRKSKSIGLCGTILVAAAIAISTASPAMAEQSSEISAETTNSQTTDDNSVVFTSETASESTTDIGSTVSQEVTTGDPATAPVEQVSDDAGQPLSAANEMINTEVNNVNTETPQVANTVVEVSDSPNYTKEDAYGSMNFDSILYSFPKAAQVADIVYHGTRDEFITLSDPSATYVPNPTEIAKYLNQYLTELRAINGIDIPVPDASQVMMDYAQARANEEVNEEDDLDHDSHLDFPEGLDWFAENAHLDSFSRIRRTNGELSISSDKATAYYLALNWFSDYFNILDDPNDGLQSFGHAISILSDTGSQMGLGFAAAKGSENGNWYALLEFAANGDGSNESGFTSEKNANGDWVLKYQGKVVQFLPNTTFWYIDTRIPLNKDDNNDTTDNNTAPSAPENQVTEQVFSVPSSNQPPVYALKQNQIQQNSFSITLHQKASVEETPRMATQETLPITGEETRGMLTVLGWASFLFSGGYLLRKHKIKISKK